MVELVLALFGFALLLAALYPFVKGKARQSTLDLLQSELGVEREARAEQDKRYAREMGELRGRVGVLTHDFAKVIASEVVKVLRSDGIIQ